MQENIEYQIILDKNEYYLYIINNGQKKQNLYFCCKKK